MPRPSAAFALLLFAVSLIAACSDPVDLSNHPCQPIDHRGDTYIVCSFDAATDQIKLFHSDAEGMPFLQFDTLARELSETGETLIFAMNGGMYHDDRRPVGYYLDEYGDQGSVNTNDGPGNFHLKPNGVFWITPDMAGVSESAAFLAAELTPTYATQSGPMMVVDGELHPEINPDGTSRRRRNGVGVDEDGRTVRFAISDGAVSFYDFATLFRDRLGLPNALFLDGQVSRLYAPGINRNEVGADMGPIVGVVQ
ncbi:MAG: phosphodiester glycosidase family protein [Pseudomonadota bacterium]